MRIFALVPGLMILGSCRAGADEERAPRPLVFTSKQGDVLFIMVPPEKDSGRARAIWCGLSTHQGRNTWYQQKYCSQVGTSR